MHIDTGRLFDPRPCWNSDGTPLIIPAVSDSPAQRIGDEQQVHCTRPGPPFLLAFVLCEVETGLYALNSGQPDTDSLSAGLRAASGWFLLAEPACSQTAWKLRRLVSHGKAGWPSCLLHPSGPSPCARQHCSPPGPLPRTLLSSQGSPHIPVNQKGRTDGVRMPAPDATSSVLTVHVTTRHNRKQRFVRSTYAQNTSRFLERIIHQATTPVPAGLQQSSSNRAAGFPGRGPSPEGTPSCPVRTVRNGVGCLQGSICGEVCGKQRCG